MPDKEGAEEKSTKSVVNKKQKQMMGEEGYDVARDEGRVKPSKDKKDGTSYPPSEEMKKTQKKNEGPSALEIVKKKYGKAVMDMKKEEIDLTKVAESFGGQIVGEPVELDEGLASFTTRAVQFLKKPAARKTFQQFVDLGKKYKGKIKTFFDKRKLNKIFKKSKGFDKIGGPDYYTRIPKPPIKEPFKPLKPLKDFIRTGTEKAKTQFQKIKDTLKKNKKKDTSYDLSKDYNVSGNKSKSKFGTTTKVVAGTGTGLGIGTLIGTQFKKRGGGGFRMGGLPGTAHNVGRRSNPQ